MTKKSMVMAMALVLGISVVAPVISAKAKVVTMGTQAAALATDTDAGVENMVELNESNFPDDVFRRYLEDEFDEDGDGWINASEVKEIKIVCSYDYGDRVQTLEGIDNFVDLTYLDCSYNDLV